MIGEPGRAESWALLGERYRAGGWLAEAAACYREAERLEPAAFRWSYLLGHVLTESDLRASADAFARALAIDDAYAPAHLHYAERLVQLGRAEEAQNAARRASLLEVPADGWCRLFQAAIERGTASTEFRPSGANPIRVISDQGLCPIEGFIRPPGQREEPIAD